VDLILVQQELLETEFLGEPSEGVQVLEATILMSAVALASEEVLVPVLGGPLMLNINQWKS